jgi:hypothetical protein
MDLLLERFSYASSETEGVLNVAAHDLATIERPWCLGILWEGSRSRLVSRMESIPLNPGRDRIEGKFTFSQIPNWESTD